MLGKVLYLLPVYSLTLLIAWASSQTFSAENTGSWLRVLLEILWPGLDPLRQQALHGALRKAGHMLAYGLLALGWQGAQNQSYICFTRRSTLYSLLIVLSLACWDEWNQSLIPSRTGTPWDLLWDLGGASLALAFQLLVSRLEKSGADSLSPS